MQHPWQQISYMGNLRLVTGRTARQPIWDLNKIFSAELDTAGYLGSIYHEPPTGFRCILFLP